MKLIRPSTQILSNLDGFDILRSLELAGRVCYKSEDSMTAQSSERFVKMLISRGHESVLEHEKITIKFICDRGVSHELVRHRIASYSQESTRYCNYSKDKFDNQLTFIIPYWITGLSESEYIDRSSYQHLEFDLDKRWCDMMMDIELVYNDLIQGGWQPQQVRTVLPNSLKTEVVVTANIREWRVIFKQRTAKAANPQMRELMCPLLDELKTIIPVIFDDITY